MDLEKNNMITPSEFVCILIAITINESVAGLPNYLVEECKQDAWIAALLGMIYPVYVILIAIYISSKHPDKNILLLSKMYFGKIIGGILNFLFFISFFLSLLSFLPINANIFKTYVIPFMSYTKIYIVVLLVGMYVGMKGLRVLGKVSIFNFYIMVFIILSSLLVFRAEGSIKNLTPVLQSDISSILKGSLRTVYDYSGPEFIFLIYPFIVDKSKIKSSSLKFLFFSCFVFEWVVVLSIYHLGVDIIPKTLWAFFYTTEAIRIGIINNFRYILIFFWILIGLKSVALLYYICVFILKDNFNIKKEFYIYLILGIIAFIIVTKYYKNRLVRNNILYITSPLSTIYNLIYCTLIALFIFFKKDDLIEQK